MCKRRVGSLTVRILLIDDQPVVRAGLRALLEVECDLEVVGEVGSGADTTNARAIRASCKSIADSDLRKNRRNATTFTLV
jgi:DNA-binding NarL/FixJ family response regulator